MQPQTEIDENVGFADKRKSFNTTPLWFFEQKRLRPFSIFSLRIREGRISPWKTSSSPGRKKFLDESFPGQETANYRKLPSFSALISDAAIRSNATSRRPSFLLGPSV
ncbi:hypothetical protein KM043_006687 [Ampulex compressa]|nr:hypothetical protein KM043_006687 [Ampulex compressa]